jgi:uncharacterized membrane protein (DUF373 family)
MTDDEPDDDQRRRRDPVGEQGTLTRTAPEGAVNRATTRSLHNAEDVLYALIAVVLVAGAVLALGDAGAELLKATKGVKKAIGAMLGSLLLVFILAELISAVRETIAERQLLAEPFLLVGTIAAIKEIVTVASFAQEKTGRAFTNAMVELGVLGGLVVALAVATYVLRLKERQPEESE